VLISDKSLDVAIADDQQILALDLDLDAGRRASTFRPGRGWMESHEVSMVPATLARTDYLTAC
jgi:hypothetical protein